MTSDFNQEKEQRVMILLKQVTFFSLILILVGYGLLDEMSLFELREKLEQLKIER